MIIKQLSECFTFTAGDNALLKEILHPDKQPLNIHYSLAWARVECGKKTRPHKLKFAEVYYIIQGFGMMHINNEENLVKTNDTIYIPPNAIQFIENVGEENLDFLCIVDPPWRPEIEHILKNDWNREYYR